MPNLGSESASIHRNRARPRHHNALSADLRVSVLAHRAPTADALQVRSERRVYAFSAELEWLLRRVTEHRMDRSLDWSHVVSLRGLANPLKLRQDGLEIVVYVPIGRAL